MEDGAGGGLGDRLRHRPGGLDDEAVQHANRDVGATPGAAGESNDQEDDDQGGGGLVVARARPDGVVHC